MHVRYTPVDSFSFQIEIDQLQRQLARIDVGPIGEDDHCELVIRQPLNRGVEAAGVAIVPHPAMTFVWVEKPPEAVFRLGAIGERDSSIDAH